MKKLWPNKKSRQLWLLGALMMPLTACNVGTTGSIVVPTDFNVGVNVNDATSTVTVTKKVTPATAEKPAVPATGTTPAVPAVPGTPASVTYTPSGSGSASFTFGSRPGSDAGNVTGYRIVKDVINGVDVTAKADSTVQKLNIYVQSGYTCDLINPVDPSKPKNPNASCNPFESQPYPAGPYLGPGTITTPLDINFTSGLVDLVIASDASVGRTTIIEFTGFTARGKTFAIQASVNSSAIRAGDR
ncbi:hypothetical protein [Deinococcus sp.]|uniref:hypothetical protein n=1 Tax=Deinococcus sp. TaxID=47478 RepID=UPI0025F40983|nr:hypothetical protein [Deinococcus sp.]